MTEQEVAQKMNEASLEEFGQGFLDADWDKPLVEYNFNSLKYVQLLVLFEGVFDIEFEDELLNIDALPTLNKIKECIQSKVSE